MEGVYACLCVCACVRVMCACACVCVCECARSVGTYSPTQSITPHSIIEVEHALLKAIESGDTDLGTCVRVCVCVCMRVLILRVRLF